MLPPTSHHMATVVRLREPLAAQVASGLCQALSNHWYFATGLLNCIEVPINMLPRRDWNAFWLSNTMQHVNCNRIQLLLEICWRRGWACLREDDFVLCPAGTCGVDGPRGLVRVTDIKELSVGGLLSRERWWGADRESRL